MSNWNQINRMNLPCENVLKSDQRNFLFAWFSSFRQNVNLLKRSWSDEQFVSAPKKLCVKRNYAGIF